MPTIFSKIIRGEIPCYKIAESKDFFAFLDINPIHKGHTLIIPKRAEDYFFNLTDEEMFGIMVFSKQVATALRRAITCQRIAVSVIGLEINHAHLHLIPIQSAEDINFSRKLSLSTEEMEAIRQSIRSYLPHHLI